MGPDLTAPLRLVPCPGCHAGVRPDAPWCTQCFLDLRPAPEPVHVPTAVVPAPANPPYGDVSDPLTSPLLDLALPTQPAAPTRTAEPTWPCSRCGVSNPLSADACAVCGSGFLAAAQEPMSAVIPGVGDLMDMPRGQRLGLALGFVAALMVVIALASFVAS